MTATKGIAKKGIAMTTQAMNTIAERKLELVMNVIATKGIALILLSFRCKTCLYLLFPYAQYPKTISITFSLLDTFDIQGGRFKIIDGSRFDSRNPF